MQLRLPQRGYLLRIGLRVILYGLIAYAILSIVALLEYLIIDVLHTESWILGGFIVAMKIAFEAAIIFSILMIVTEHVPIVRGRIIPPYTQTEIPLRMAASEYSLVKKKTLIIRTFLCAALLSVIADGVSSYLIRNHNDLVQTMAETLYFDGPPTFLTFVLPDVVMAMNLAPEELGPIFYWVIFSVWLPAIPLFLFFINLISYLYEVSRARLFYRVISR